MSGVLIVPRVEVFWGSDNLSHYPPSAEWTPSGIPQPLVYNCTAQQAGEGQTPSGTMMWSPHGKAFEVYQKFIADKSKMDETITMRFFYANGRSITFSFLWSGQRLVYGTTTEIEIQLTSELEGIFNTVTRNTAQAFPEKPATYKEATTGLEKQFVTEGIVRFSKKADEDSSKAKLNSNYAEDVTLGSAVKNLQEQNGNVVMPSAIGGKPGLIVHTPYTWDTEPVQEPNGDPDPAVRYGYFLGPSIYSTIERTYEWKPPQISTGRQGDFPTNVTPASGSVTSGEASWYGPGFIGNKTANGETYTAREMTAAHRSLPFGTVLRVKNENNGRVQDVRVNDRGPYVGNRILDLSEAAAESLGMKGTGVAPITMQVVGKPQSDTQEGVQKPSTAPIGTSRAKANPGVNNAENPDGPKKQEILKEEGQSQLSLSTMMVPSIVGVKPHDILFIPNFQGDFIEDWKVESVNYSQRGASIEVSIQASRNFASGSLMNKVGEEWLGKAVSLGLVGGNMSMENWEKYAWGLKGAGSNPGVPTPGGTLELEGATTLKGITDAAKRINQNAITTERGTAIPLPPSVG